MNKYTAKLYIDLIEFKTSLEVPESSVVSEEKIREILNRQLAHMVFEENKDKVIYE